ncbi:MAG: hypothetical protein AAFU64_00885 [Bacteroidota bacterium]
MKFLLAIIGGLFIIESPAQNPEHYIFFNIERDRIQESNFLHHPKISGAQLKYTWSELEPQKGQYNFQALEKDLLFLNQRGKKLFIQLQDVSFDSFEIVGQCPLRIGDHFLSSQEH